jgi:hypothetical protein
MLVWQCIDVLILFVLTFRMVKNYLGCLPKGRSIFFGNPLLIKISITYNNNYLILQMGKEKT